MYRLFIFSIIISSYLLAQENNSEIEYIIYTSLSLEASAQLISNYYNDPYDYGYINNGFDISLNTEVITTNTVSPENLNSFIFNNYSNNDGTFENLEYLLIIGDENIIEPLKFQNIAASDDYFSSEISSIYTFPYPSLKTGRILVENNYEAQLIINNIINYINNQSSGSWKSESLLIADDLFKNGKQIYEEIVHTEYSNILYEKLKNNMSISCLYGNDFPRYESSDWYTQPELNNKIIQKINNGLSIVNYIGHGTSNILADEDILAFSDINSISIENNKLPIWVVGTCSFGNYLNQNCFAEELLKKGDAAIAVISTSYNLSYDNNWIFIDNFYDNLKNHLIDENSNKRIGDLFMSSKSSSGENYIFHLFGDPAMPLNIAKPSTSLTNAINNIDVATFNTLNMNNNSLSTIKINFEDKNKFVNYLDENNTPQTLAYNIPGDILFYDVFYNSTEFILPINIDINDFTKINLHNDLNNKIQIIPNISLSLSNQYNFENLDGPNISIKHKDKTLLDGDTLYPPYNIKILFQDEEPINLSGLNDNNLRIWLNSNDQNSIIINDLFVPTESENGYSGYVDFNINNNFDLQNNNNTIKIQAWDILGESNVLNIDFKIHNDDLIYNVYNFPNPFNEKTFFTFHYSDSEIIDIQIDIFTLNGNKVKTLNASNIQPSNNTFYKVNEPWDGKDNNNNNLSNGTYIYKLRIHLSSNNTLIHEGVYKITKIN